MENNRLSPEAQQARDEILDLLVQGQKVLAIRRYMRASGKGISEAKTVIDRLSQVLEKPGLDAAERSFLAGFRATLNGPEGAPTKRVAPITSQEASARDVHPDANALGPPPQLPPKRRAPIAGHESRPRTADNRRNKAFAIDWNHFITGGGALMLVLSVICIGGSAFTLTQGFAQNSWVGIPGTIIQARMEAPTTPGKPTRKVFAYEYQVDGKTYSADRYSFENVGGARSVGIQRYDPGDRVTVYYNPQNPSVAVLEKKKPGFFVLVVLVFGIAFLLASIGSLLAGNATALFTRAGARELWRQLTYRREPLMGPAGDETFDGKIPDRKKDPRNHKTVPWYAYLAAFVIGMLLIWLPGRLIHLFDHMGAGFLSDLLGAGVAGVSFAGIAFGFTSAWPRHSRLWGMIVSLPACAVLLVWVATTMLSSFYLSPGILFTVVLTVAVFMGVSVFGGHLGAVRHRMKMRIGSGDFIAEEEISNTAFATSTSRRSFLNEVKMLFRGESVPWFGWIEIKETTSNRLYGLAGLLLALAGLFFVGKNIFLASGQDDWVPVNAVVVESYTTKSVKGSGGRTYTTQHFTYNYQVDGKQYTGDRYSFWSLAGEPGTGVALYHPGDHLTVYHHPTWPRYAVVELISPSFFTWLAGLLLVLLAVPAGWVLWTGKANG